jgi:F-type H+-transporting ATPase subunit b
MDRRMKATEAKIAQAEAQALDEVRAAAADAAVRAAEQVIAKQMDAKKQADLISDSIKDIKAKLN